MKKLIITLVLLLVSAIMLYGQKPMEEAPNVMLTYKDASFNTYHGNKPQW